MSPELRVRVADRSEKAFRGAVSSIDGVSIIGRTLSKAERAERKRTRLAAKEVESLYFSLPKETVISAAKGLPRNKKDDPNTSATNRALAMIHKRWEREGDKTRPVLSGKFKDAIVKSPTTNPFMTMASLLFDEILLQGRDSEHGIDLAIALQIRDKDMGYLPEQGELFTEEGAKEGERHLLRTVTEVFGDEVGEMLELGLDPMAPGARISTFFNFRPDLTVSGFKDFILDWRKQFRQRYGEEIY